VVQDAIGGLNLGFPGQYYDAETKTWNNGFRDYNSALGQYVESDPVGLAGGINTYAYAHGNPLSYVDPHGLDIFVANTAQVGGLHQKIVIGTPDNMLYGQSYGMTTRHNPMQWTSSAVEPTANGAGSGVVYEDEDPITGVNSALYLHTTPAEDAAAIAFLKFQVGHTGPYNVLTNSCRDYSQAQYWQLFNMILHMRHP